jgi:hypothetical protein
MLMIWAYLRTKISYAQFLRMVNYRHQKQNDDLLTLYENSLQHQLPHTISRSQDMWHQWYSDLKVPVSTIL